VDIQIFDNSTLKIKNKRTILAFDPVKNISKFDADAIVLTGGDSDISRISNPRVIIDGPGDYEISGLKISCIGTALDRIYILNSDNTNVLVAKSSAVNKMSSDRIGEHQVVILNADEDINQSIVTSMEPRVVILYGDKKKEGAKALGMESNSMVSKISISEDKLPEELKVYILG
jgi:hypothetical protein